MLFFEKIHRFITFQKSRQYTSKHLQLNYSKHHYKGLLLIETIINALELKSIPEWLLTHHHHLSTIESCDWNLAILSYNFFYDLKSEQHEGVKFSKYIQSWSKVRSQQMKATVWNAPRHTRPFVTLSLSLSLFLSHQVFCNPNIV